MLPTRLHWRRAHLSLEAIVLGIIWNREPSWNCIFYLRQSRQALRLCKLLLLLMLLLGGSSLYGPFCYTLLRHYIFTSGWDPPENGSPPVSSHWLPLYEFSLLGVGSSPLELPVMIKSKFRLDLWVDFFLGIFLLSYQCRRSLNKVCSCLVFYNVVNSHLTW